MNSNYDRNDVMEPGFGWLFFAGTILGMAGIMRLFDALWAFRYDGVVPDELEGAVLGTSLSSYGWLWLVVGVVLIVSSFAVLYRSQFARWIGIIAGAVAVHLGDLVDAVLPGVVTHVHHHRFSRRLRSRRLRRPRPRRRLTLSTRRCGRISAAGRSVFVTSSRERRAIERSTTRTRAGCTQSPFGE